MTSDEAARAFLGIPFRHQGRDPLIGIDRIGFLVLWGLLLGLDFPSFDVTTYDRNPHDGVLEGYLRAAFGAPVPLSELQAGQVIAMSHRGATRHVGVVANHPKGGLSMIHTDYFVGRVTEERIDAKAMKKITGVFNVR